MRIRDLSEQYNFKVFYLRCFFRISGSLLLVRPKLSINKSNQMKVHDYKVSDSISLMIDSIILFIVKL